MGSGPPPEDRRRGCGATRAGGIALLLALGATQCASASERHADVAACVEDGRQVGLALTEYAIDAGGVPMELRSLDLLELGPGTLPVRRYVEGRTRDPWGTPWRVVPDVRGARDIAFELDGSSFAFRGTPRFRLVSAGADRRFDTGDDLAFDELGRLLRLPDGVSLTRLFEAGGLEGLASLQASAISDAFSHAVGDRGGCPRARPTLDELAAEGYIDVKLLVDAWGRPWDYRVMPTETSSTGTGVELSLRSRGSDGRWGTEDDLVGGAVLGPCTLPPPAGCVPATLDALRSLPSERAVPALLARFSCPDQETRRIAYDAATFLADPRLTLRAIERYPDETLPCRSRIMRLLGVRRDPRALPLVLSVLGEAPDAPGALEAIGSPASLPAAIDAYLRPWSWKGATRLRLLELFVKWAPADDGVLALIEEALDAAPEREKPMWASLALRAQVEPGRPAAWGSELTTREQDCMTFEEWELAVAPFARRDAERILRPRNERLLRLAGAGAEWTGGTTFNVLDRTLDPAARAELWRRLIAALGDDPGDSPDSWSCAPYHVREALVRALLALATTKLPGDVPEARRLLAESQAIAAPMEHMLAVRAAPSPTLRAIASVRARLEKLEGAEEDPPELPHRFTSRSGRMEKVLWLDSGEAYRKTWVVDHVSLPCHPSPDRLETGRYLVERGFVLLFPADGRGGGLPETYRIVSKEDAVALEGEEATYVSEEQPGRAGTVR